MSKIKEASENIWVASGLCLSILLVAIAYNYLFDLRISYILLVMSVPLSGYLSFYLFQKMLRIFWSLALVLMVFALIYLTIYLWGNIITRSIAGEDSFLAYLMLDSAKKIIIFSFLTFTGILLSLRFTKAFHFVSLLLIVGSLPLAVTVFDNTFYYRWEQGLIIFSWFIFFILTLSLLFFYPGRSFLFQKSKSRLKLVAFTVSTGVILFGLSLFLLYSGSGQITAGVMKRDGDFFHFKPFLKLEPRISLSYQRLMIAEMKERRHIRHFVLSGFDKKGEFIPGDPKWEKADPPKYRKRPDQGWVRKVDRKRIVRSGLQRKYLQKYYLKHFAPGINFGVNQAQKISAMENKTPEKFSGILLTESLLWDTGKTAKKSKGTETKMPLLSLAGGKERQKNNTSRKDREFLRYYTETGSTPFSQRVKKLSREITKGRENKLEKTLAIQNYLARNYIYSLTPGGENIENRLEHFIFQNKRGYCTYFAFAFGMMARSLGIPSRVAVGFLPDERLRKFNYWWILGAQAHAWVEIYFSETGWLTFDVPTSNPFSGALGAKPLDLRKELKDDLLAIEKNLNSKIMKEWAEKKRAFDRKKLRKRLYKTGSHLLIFSALLFLWLLFQNYRFKIMAIIFRGKSYYWLFKNICWSLARFGYTRPKGISWGAAARELFDPRVAALFTSLERDSEALLSGALDSRNRLAKETEITRKINSLGREVNSLVSEYSLKKKLLTFLSPLVWKRYRP